MKKEEINEVKESLFKKTKELKKDVRKNRSMGLGELGDTDIVFVRKFRWTFGGKLSEYLFTKVNFDFVKQQVYFEAMEYIKIDSDKMELHEWLDGDVSKEYLFFVTFDGCGKPLYEYKISGLEILEDKSDFDYSSSDVSSRKVLLHYCEIERTYLAVEGAKSIKKKCYLFTLNIEDASEEYDVKVNKNPTVNIEETEVNFLNGKTWIPGKAEWESIKFTLKNKALLGRLIRENNLNLNLVLNLYDFNKKQKIESWIFEDCRLESMNNLLDAYEHELNIKFKSARYKNWINDGK